MTGGLRSCHQPPAVLAGHTPAGSRPTLGSSGTLLRHLCLLLLLALEGIHAGTLSPEPDLFLSVSYSRTGTAWASASTLTLDPATCHDSRAAPCAHPLPSPPGTAWASACAAGVSRLVSFQSSTHLVRYCRTGTAWAGASASNTHVPSSTPSTAASSTGASTTPRPCSDSRWVKGNMV